MTSISLTEFVDFVVATGTQKLTRVRQIKAANAEDYKPWKDYWKILRDGIVDFHAVAKGDRKFLDRLLEGIPQEDKGRAYESLIANYKRYLGRKVIVTLPPDRHILWTYKDLQVRVNPELRLNVNQEETVIKLYFKRLPLATNRINIILLLMKHALPTTPAGVVTYCLHDVHHNKVYSNKNPSDDLLPLLYGEADSFLTMWQYV